MTDAARTITVSPETTLKQVADLMVEHRISGLPVVDADGRVLGVVTEADFVTGETGGTGGEGMLARARALARPASVAIPRTAGEAMNSPAVTIGPDEAVMHAAGRIATLDGGAAGQQRHRWRGATIELQSSGQRAEIELVVGRQAA